MTSRGIAVPSLFVVVLACGGAGDDRANPVVFRVGATAGLAPLAPGPLVSSSSAAAMDLVFEVATDHVSEMRAEGRRVLMTRRPDSPFTTEQLARSLRYPGLLAATAVDSEHIEAEYRDEKNARSSVDPITQAAFDVGPFRVELQRSGRAQLRRRAAGAIDVIEIFELPASDEWRKLMARELDVMPFSPSIYRNEFEGMGSVRLLDIPPTLSAALFFNVRDPDLQDPRVRRRIAASLNRPAIARVASGDPSSAEDAPVRGPIERVPLPHRLTLLVGQDESTLLLAASVLRHQLDRLGVMVDVVPMKADDLLAEVERGRHQLVLGPLPIGERRFGRFVSPRKGDPPMSGFIDPAYDAAVAGKDLARAQAILDEEVPATPLYEWRAFAAIDSRFCGNVTPSAHSWRWMADLHPCDEAEVQAEDRR